MIDRVTFTATGGVAELLNPACVAVARVASEGMACSVAAPALALPATDAVAAASVAKVGAEVADAGEHGAAQRGG